MCWRDKKKFRKNKQRNREANKRKTKKKFQFFREKTVNFSSRDTLLCLDIRVTYTRRIFLFFLFSKKRARAIDKKSRLICSTDETKMCSNSGATEQKIPQHRTDTGTFLCATGMDWENNVQRNLFSRRYPNTTISLPPVRREPHIQHNTTQTRVY